MSRTKTNQNGFTVLELMIATVVFSVLLLLAANLLVQIGRLYYKGVISSRTQETARSITDDIGRTLQFSGENITTASQPFQDFPSPNGTGNVRIYAFCIGGVRYSYIIDAQVNSSVQAYEPGQNRENYVPHALWRDEGADLTVCSPVNLLNANEVAATNGREMLSEGMRLYRLTAPQDDPTTGLASFAVGVVYGQDDILIEFVEADGEITTVRCRGSGLGSQWCANAELTTTVFRRIQQ